MKFDGTNYQRWERKVHNVLARADLLHYALNGPRKYDQEAHAFVVGDRKSVALISDYLSDNILMELPSDLFAFLRSRETKTNSARLLDHIRDKYKETSTIQARHELTYSTQGERSLAEYYAYRLLCWKEAGGEQTVSGLTFCATMVSAVHPHLEEKIRSKLTQLLKDISADSERLVEEFGKSVVKE
jgi:hypothetical protein